MNYILLGVIIIFTICMIVGYVRGFIRIAVSLGATVATVALVFFLTPHISNLICKVTPLDDMIKEKVYSAMTPDLSNLDLGSIDLSSLGIPGLEGVDLEGVDLEALGITEEKIQELMKDVEIPRQTQIEAIEQADIPEIFREMLLSNNNSEVYKELGVTSFQDYVGAYLARVIVNMAAFLLTLVVVTVVVRGVMYSFDLLSKLPVINGMNRFAGALVGMVTALIIVWVLFLVVTLLYETGVGKECFRQIRINTILNFLYENNLIMKWVLSFR